VVKLTSTTSKETIEVVFDVQDEANEGEYEGFEEDEEGDMEDDEEEGGGIGIKFHVSVQKKHTEDKVVFYCVAGQQISVVNTQYLPAGKGVEDTDIYHGPLFDKLSDDLKESMLSYLADRGIDEDMAFFIMAYSENKEQREYMHWLKKLMVFVEAK
jgi:complement component 1 Q subcomponent-binding protein, mitochondrial